MEHQTESNNNQPSDPIVLVCAADDNYAMPLAVTLRSVLENVGKDDRSLSFFIIGNGISSRNKMRIQKTLNSNSCSLQWLEIRAEELHKLSCLADVPWRLPISAYYRLFIPELLPNHIRKTIYLDSDLILCQDIGLLWDLEVGENALAAVQDIGVPFVSSKYGLNLYSEIGLEPECKYFNSGVLLINLDIWRTEEISKKVIEYSLKNQRHIQFADQDGLNATLANRWLELDPRWNQQASLFEYDSWQETSLSEACYNQLLVDPYVVHFSKKKPWKSLDPHPYKYLFYKYIDKTDWKGFRFSYYQRLWRKIIKGLKKSP